MISRGNFWYPHLLLREPEASTFNREFNPLNSFEWDSSADIVTGQLPEEMIECGSEVMDDFSDDDANSEVEVPGNIFDSKDIIARSRFEFGANWKSRRGSLFLGGDHLFEGISEFMRPLDFDSILGEVNSHGNGTFTVEEADQSLVYETGP